MPPIQGTNGPFWLKSPPDAELGGAALRRAALGLDPEAPAAPLPPGLHPLLPWARPSTAATDHARRSRPRAHTIARGPWSGLIASGAGRHEATCPAAGPARAPQ